MNNMASLARNSSDHKRQKPSTDIDRISTLPDSILSHILSLLPPDHAVATSLISTRWKFLWTKIYNLSFGDIDSRFCFGGLKFTHFVNRVLLFTSQQSIEKFYLEIYENSEIYDVNTWVATAVARNVKVLEIVLSTFSFSELRIQLPYSLCTCNSLEVLILRSSVNLNVPSLVSLPNLKNLRLEGVIYQCDQSVRNLLSGCSSLKTLYIQRDLYDNVVTYTISSPTLINLTFKFYEEESPFPTLDYKLEINAPALKYLNLYDSLSKEFSINNLCSLHEATIWTRDINVDFLIGEQQFDLDLYSAAVVELIRSVSNVKHLSLQGDTLEVLSHAGVWPSFSRLTQLTVEPSFCPWNSLLSLIQGSNKLSHISLKKSFHHYKRTPVTSLIEPERVPICLLSCLKTMSMSGFECEEEELEMVAYILKNAKLLRTMKIKTTNDLDVATKFQLLQKVSMFPRRSEKCQISFS